MSRKLNRILDEIQKTEEKIAVWQEHLKELNLLREQLENQEIIKSIRSMKLDSRRMLDILSGIQNGSVSFQYAGEDTPGTAAEINREEELPDMAGHIEVPYDRTPESEDRNDEEN